MDQGLSSNGPFNYRNIDTSPLSCISIAVRAMQVGVRVYFVLGAVECAFFFPFHFFLFTFLF